MCKMNWQLTQWSTQCSWSQCHPQNTCSNKNQVSGTLWWTPPHKNQPNILSTGIHMRRVSLMQAMCMYRCGQRLRSAELKTGWTKVAKFVSYMYISKVSQPFLSAKMAWCNFCLSPEEGGHDHVIATTNWHSKIKKYGYKVNKQLYGQSSDGRNGRAMCSTKLNMPGS